MEKAEPGARIHGYGRIDRWWGDNQDYVAIDFDTCSHDLGEGKVGVSFATHNWQPPGTLVGFDGTVGERERRQIRLGLIEAELTEVRIMEVVTEK